jgi:hypothetical protein
VLTPARLSASTCGALRVCGVCGCVCVESPGGWRCTRLAVGALFGLWGTAHGMQHMPLHRNCSACGTQEYASAPCTVSSNTQCANVSSCVAGQYIAIQSTASSDRYGSESRMLSLRSREPPVRLPFVSRCEEWDDPCATGLTFEDQAPSVSQVWLLEARALQGIGKGEAPPPMHSLIPVARTA